jgi:hypothetical protein
MRRLRAACWFDFAVAIILARTASGFALVPYPGLFDVFFHSLIPFLAASVLRWRRVFTAPTWSARAHTPTSNSFN